MLAQAKLRGGESRDSACELADDAFINVERSEANSKNVRGVSTSVKPNAPIPQDLN